MQTKKLSCFLWKEEPWILRTFCVQLVTRCQLPLLQNQNKERVNLLWYLCKCKNYGHRVVGLYWSVRFEGAWMYQVSEKVVLFFFFFPLMPSQFQGLADFLNFRVFSSWNGHLLDLLASVFSRSWMTLLGEWEWRPLQEKSSVFICFRTPTGRCA